MPAEGVLRRAGIELVGLQIVGAAQEFEARVEHRQMQDALLGADRAIALADDGVRQIDLDAKPDPAAMAAAFIALQHGLTPPPLPSRHYGAARRSCQTPTR